MANTSMLVNVSKGEECRIALIENGRLEELYTERTSAVSHVGNIYKGRITNIEPSIQAAFIDFGLPKNGFLHISDVHPQYFGQKFREEKGSTETVGHKTPRRDRPPIQRCLHRGQEVIVQITKEGIGTKGPTLTTYLSIPGKYLVMMPGMTRLGVSRKIEDDEARKKLRDIMDELDPPKDMGFIVRTAGIDRTKRELQRDLNYLKRLWQVVTKRQKSLPAPAELYQESDLIIRTIRDVVTSDVEQIIIDDADASERASEFISICMPRSQDRVIRYDDRMPLFHRYGIESQIERIYSRRVDLPSGGSIVIDQAEALVAIDVNSGKYRELNDADETAYRINLEAADEIARQLRLRDMGGVIVCDFIDMRAERRRRGVEKALRDAMKKDRGRSKILRISQFGIVEMTRQRMRPSLKRSIYEDCPCCRGSGLVKSAESVCLDVMRTLHLLIDAEQISRVEVRVSPIVAQYLFNRKRASLTELEQQTNKTIELYVEHHAGPDIVEYRCWDNLSREIPFELPRGSDMPAPDMTPLKSKTEDRSSDNKEADGESTGTGRSRRSRRRRPAAERQPSQDEADDSADSDSDNTTTIDDETDADEKKTSQRSSSRKRSRRKRSSRSANEGTNGTTTDNDSIVKDDSKDTDAIVNEVVESIVKDV